jgi:polyisoprenoid-binding protein YceI
MVVISLAGPAWAQGALYIIDPTHTSVTFEANHLGLSTLRGRFDRVAGSVMFDKLGRSARADITVETTSLSIGAASLDARLKGAEFLNTSEFATARFVADSFTFTGQKISAADGTLTLLDKTHAVTLKASHFNCYFNLLVQREVCGGEFETTISPSRWGMDSAPTLGLADSIKLLIQVEAIKQ